jgi:prepilin-type processing-associated H-X9-DG protein
MLFPVFARARESARKIQCLSNVKNIAMAVQMYLSDYDRFPPAEHRREAIDSFVHWIGSDRGCGEGPEYRATWGNPYLRWPVILEEYIKNRDVWRCPSAKWDPSNWWIIPGYDGDYLRYLTATHGDGWVANGWSPGGSPCFWSFPPGWGGDVTDSIAQQAGEANPATNVGVFSATIGYPTEMTDAKTSQLDDVSKTVACADGTTFGVWIRGAGDILYEVCQQGCGNSNYYNPDCSGSQQCSFPAEDLPKFQNDSTYRRQYTRHLGGSNVGFADGHAGWFSADAFVADAPYCDDNGNYITQGKFGGLCP